ncbi:MAG TPA: resolvase [Lachnospiraceae bacterium]|nr:resolvase [Lachnospiraceae bacterium]
MGGRILDYEAKRIKAEGLQEGRKEGRKEGKIEGQIETLIELVKDNILSVQEAASRASLPEARFREQMRKYGG